MNGSLFVHQSGMQSVLRAAASRAAVQTCAQTPARETRCLIVDCGEKAGELCSGLPGLGGSQPAPSAC